jgi:hypothetical protein
MSTNFTKSPGSRDLWHSLLPHGLSVSARNWQEPPYLVHLFFRFVIKQLRWLMRSVHFVSLILAVKGLRVRRRGLKSSHQGSSGALAGGQLSMSMMSRSLAVDFSLKKFDQ